MMGRWSLSLLLAALAGVLTVGAFAPFNLWPLAVLAPLGLLLMWRDATPGRAFLTGWLYGLGLMGAGVYWLTISIGIYSGGGLAMGVLLTVLLVMIMALYYGAAGWLAVKLASGDPRRLWFTAPGAWVLMEWLRGWLFTGFPWLNLGSAMLDSPLGGWAPLGGVYLMSLLVMLAVTSLLRPRPVPLLGVVLLWTLGLLLGKVQFTEPSGEPIPVAIVQGNIPQDQKWRAEMYLPTLRRYLSLTERAAGARLVVWPETAVPAYAHRAEMQVLEPLEELALQRGQDVLLGIPVMEPDGRYYNAMLQLGAGGRDLYAKRHLVPFGEFVPFEKLLRPVTDLLAIPLSSFSPGDKRRPPRLTLAGHPAGIGICYEDAFGREVIEALPEAAFLVNASNDAWFGDSLAPHQHLAMARLRAAETGRYLLRATNTGISAIIAPNGALAVRSPQFEADLLQGLITPRRGATPYVRLGDWPAAGLALGLLLAGGLARRRRSAAHM
jgi:apolipoprotein N-acyltransferase